MVVGALEVGKLHKRPAGKREALLLLVPSADADTRVKARVNLLGSRDEVGEVSELLAEDDDTAALLPDTGLQPNLMGKSDHLDRLSDEDVALTAALLTAEENLERGARKGYLLARKRLPEGFATVE
jgi:hypothetical protein